MWKYRRPVSIGRVRRQLHAAADIAVGLLHQAVDQAADLTHVARHFRQADLGVVQFLEHDNGDIDVVLMKPQDRRRIVDQDVGVEDEDLVFRCHGRIN